MTQDDERNAGSGLETPGDRYDEATDPLTHRLEEADEPTEVIRRPAGWDLRDEPDRGRDDVGMGRVDQAGGQAGLASADPPDGALTVDTAEQGVVDPGGDPRDA